MKAETTADQGTASLLASAFSKKVNIVDEPISFAFSFDLKTDEDPIKKKKKKKKKKKTKIEIEITGDNKHEEEVTSPPTEPSPSTYIPTAAPHSPIKAPFTTIATPNRKKNYHVDSPGPQVISSRDPELDPEQRRLRKFGKGLNVSIIGPRKKVTSDWKDIPPGFKEIATSPPSHSSFSNGGSSHDSIQSTANPFTFGFM